MKKIFVDCQLLQTDAFNRGMGKYSLSLLKALSENRQFQTTYSIVLIFNNNLPLTSKRIGTIGQYISTNNYLKVDLPVNIEENIDDKYLDSSKLLEATIERQLGPNEQAAYLILCPFFMSFVAAFPKLSNVTKYCLVYDLIPYIIWYKQRIFPDNIYLKHYQLLSQADHLFTISETVKNNLIEILGIAGHNITNIDGGPFETEDDKQQTEYADTYYILYPSAPISHKNNENAIKGFELFNKSQGNKYKLILTSTFDESSQKLLRQLSSNIIFTGNVSDSELVQLYRHCACLLFASLIEGLGMPVLEAVTNDRPVACSNIDVLTEISKLAFYLFDPYQPDQIAKALSSAISKQNWAQKHSQYNSISIKYQWIKSAKKATEVFERTLPTPQKQPFKELLVICPDPSRNKPANRFIEKFYATISKVYDTKLQFYQTQGKQIVSYVKYIADKPEDNFNEPEIIYISNSQRLKKISKKNNQNLLHICITKQGRTKLLSHFMNNRLSDHQINISASATLVDNTLKFPGGGIIRLRTKF